MARKKPDNKVEAFNFESSLRELNTIVEKMEAGGLSLEDSLRYFEQGIALTRQCQQTLQEAEQKVQILLEKNGQTHLQSFTAESDEA